MQREGEACPGVALITVRLIVGTLLLQMTRAQRCLLFFFSETVMCGHYFHRVD